MPVDVSSLLEKERSRLAAIRDRYPRRTPGRSVLPNVENIRQMQLFGGQARSAASTEALAFAQLALSVASHSNSDNLRAEAHRMMAYVLNANEQYEPAILRLHGRHRCFWSASASVSKSSSTRLGLISALFMTGRYEQALRKAVARTGGF